MQPFCENLRDDFVIDITQCNRSIICNCLRALDLRYQSDVRLIILSVEGTRDKEILYFFNNFSLNGNPIGVEETSQEAIRSRDLIRMDGKYCISDFQGRRYLYELRVLSLRNHRLETFLNYSPSLSLHTREKILKIVDHHAGYMVFLVGYVTLSILDYKKPFTRFLFFVVAWKKPEFLSPNWSHISLLLCLQ